MQIHPFVVKDQKFLSRLKLNVLEEIIDDDNFYKKIKTGEINTNIDFKLKGIVPKD